VRPRPYRCAGPRRGDYFQRRAVSRRLAWLCCSTCFLTYLLLLYSIYFIYYPTAVAFAWNNALHSTPHSTLNHGYYSSTHAGPGTVPRPDPALPCAPPALLPALHRSSVPQGPPPAPVRLPPSPTSPAPAASPALPVPGPHHPAEGPPAATGPLASPAVPAYTQRLQLSLAPVPLPESLQV
jgi:hypothetical protein